jgi:rare lipoprotein A
MSRKKCYEKSNFDKNVKPEIVLLCLREVSASSDRGDADADDVFGTGIMMRTRRRAALPLALIAIAACGRKHAHVSRVPSTQPATTKPAVAVAPGYTEEGVASWYGPPYHGRAAADGEIYDMETLVAAHREMPFNTWLRVTNLANGKTVDVRIIDRGPFVRGRILDLSKAAARQIDLLGPGIGRVRLEVIAAPADIPANDFYAVQVGAFALRENADRLRSELSEKYGPVQLVVKQGSVPLWRVLVGKESSSAAAQHLANELSSIGSAVFVVRLDQTIVNPAENPPVATLPGETPPAANPQP